MNGLQKADILVGQVKAAAEQSFVSAKSEPETDKSRIIRPPAENKILSVIMRCHRRERLPFLEEAIFSLAIQDWTDLEIVVVIQNGNGDFIRAVRQIIEQQPWRKKPQVKVHSIEFREGFDGRSSLLNYGIAHSTGRYLAFLDDDDVVYQHGYATLINKFSEGRGAALAVGGCRVAKQTQKSDHWYISAKETPFASGRSRYDLFRDNFIPIHSYVIDREAVSESDLYFDDEMPPLEDYEFLLRLGSKYEFDFSGLDVFVCEYRIHDSNSLPYSNDATDEQKAKHLRAFELIEERKKNLSCVIPLRDLIPILKQDIKIEEQRAQIERQKNQIEELETQIERQETQIEALQVPVTENPKVVREVLISFGDKIYDIFEKYPRVEKKLSNAVHYGWNIYQRKRKSSPADSD